MKNIIYKKRIISILLILSLVLNNVFCLYAKKASFEEGEVESPTGVENDFTSEGIIIHEEKSDEITPLHATPSYMMSEEYKNVDNFIIDIKTIPDRIKYFSPTYINYKNTAVNKIRSSFYSAGGSEYNYYFVKNTINDLPDQKRLANSTLKELNNNLKKLESLGIHSGPQYEALVAGITEVNIAIATIDATSSSLSQAALGFGSAVRMINNIDSNNSMQYLNNTLSKSLINAFLSYKQLEFYESLLNKQVKLYENMVNVYIGNYAHGISTSDELRKQILNLENAKKTRSSIKSTKNNVKEMIAINLGYEKKDFDRLIFVEPEIDYTYLYEVSPSSHYEQAYNSNTVYNNIRTSGRSDKKLPGSTGDAIKEQSLKQAKNKIINKLDYLFDTMKTSFYLYSESKYLSEIIKLNEEANKRKYDTNLVSDVEYEGLRVQNEANIMSLKTMKYDLIKNAINYKYAILGIMDIE